MIKSVLVTGGTGYIGAHLIKALCKCDYEVSVVTRNTSSLRLLEDVLEEIDCYRDDGQPGTLSKILAAVKPELVIHIAGVFVSEHKVDDIELLIRDNIIFGTYLLEAMKEQKVSYFINTGTNWQKCEAQNNTPVNLYAATKEAYAQLADYYVDSQDMRMITLNLLDTYGPFDPRKKIINLLKDVAITNKQLEMSPGEQEIGLVYIDDVVTAYMSAIELLPNMQKRERRKYCVAPKEMVNLKTLVNTFQKVHGSKLPIEMGKRPYRVREVMKAELQHPNILEGKATISLEEGIKKILQIESKYKE